MTVFALFIVGEPMGIAEIVDKQYFYFFIAFNLLLCCVLLVINKSLLFNSEYMSYILMTYFVVIISALIWFLMILLFSLNEMTHLIAALISPVFFTGWIFYLFLTYFLLRYFNNSKIKRIF